MPLSAAFSLDAPDSPGHVAWCETLADLAAIRMPDITMAIHPRIPDAAIAAFLSQRSISDFWRIFVALDPA